MPKNNKKKIYCSMIEIEKEFFPALYRERIQERKDKDPSSFGTELATEILKSIKQELAK